MNQRITGCMKSLVATLILFCTLNSSLAQNTAFTYQGKLTENGNPANGNYDFEFKLFDALSGGAQQGSTIQQLSVAVTAGIFTVGLDFGNQFTGAARFLDISVRQAGSGAFTALAPRQQVSSNPYAIKSLNATVADGLSLACVNCVTSTQIGSVNGSAVSGQIPVASVPAGSASYVQNTTSPQTSSNFNISGTGTANILNAAAQYNINGLRALSAPGNSNFFAGLSAGQNNTTGLGNSFFGSSSGGGNTTGNHNSFFGVGAGNANSSGAFNSFFGSNAGALNTASQNSFFGGAAGVNNTTGDSNAFFGYTAGEFNVVARANSFFGANAGRNTNANDNSFFGTSAGLNNTTGTGNTFLGRSAGLSNTTESNNTFIGFNSNGAAGIMNASAIGANAVVTTSNTIVLGTNSVTVQVPGTLNVAGTFGANILNATTQFNINGSRVLSNQNGNLAVGLNSATGSSGSLNAFFGNGTGAANTTGSSNAFFGAIAGNANTSGGGNSFFGSRAGNQNITGSSNSFFGSGAGEANTASGNSFFGNSAGLNNTSGDNNAFFGFQAGNANSTGSFNSFFGRSAGLASTADNNSFFGALAGRFNTTGAFNSFFGTNAGKANTTSNENAFFGYNAGTANIAEQNSFFGAFAGAQNTTGSFNTFFGYSAGSQNDTANANTFIGWQSGTFTQTSGSNTFVGFETGHFNVGNDNSFFGSAAGGLNSTGIFNSFFGSNAGYSNAAGVNNTFSGYLAGYNTTSGDGNTFFGSQSGFTNSVGSNNTTLGFSANVASTNLTNATAIGAGSVASLSNSIFLGRADGSDAVRIPGSVVINGTLVVSTLGSAGSTSICLNAASRISPCSSSLRYKTSVQSFTTGLEIVRRLRPILFNWKDGGMKDVGFAAEEVNKVEPLLTTHNDRGEIEGVKYAQLTTVLVNAVKELQQTTEHQQRQISEQKRRLEALKKLVASRIHGPRKQSRMRQGQHRRED